MAKKLYKPPKHFTGHTITTKTHFGSHSDMIVDHSKTNINLIEGQVLCKDDQGYYITTINRIDDNLADPNRYANLNNRVYIEDTKQEENSSSS